MKNTTLLKSSVLIILLIVTFTSISHAQFRKDRQRASDLTGPVIKEDPSDGAKLGNLFNMQMDHSYSMTFASAGGQYQNQNAYTNTMHFFFSDDLTGRVDLQLLHSPFGNNPMAGSNSKKNIQFRLRNAELNYDLSDNSSISVQFQQVPSYGYGYSPFNRSPFGRAYSSPFHQQNY